MKVKNEIIEEVLKTLKKDFENKDYTVLEELLQKLPSATLLNALNEETARKLIWKEQSSVLHFEIVLAECRKCDKIKKLSFKKGTTTRYTWCGICQKPVYWDKL